jgi:hydrogenase maturation protease
MSKLAVVGIGNLLMQDEGIGVQVIKELEKMKCLSEEIDLIDAGVNTYDMVDVLCQYEHLIIVDAMQAGAEPGTIYRAPLEELGLQPDKNITSLHEMHFIEAIRMVNLMGFYPEVLVFGIEPKTIQIGLELTPEIAAQVPRIIELIQQDAALIMGR